MGDLTPAETMRWFSVNEEYMLEALSLYAEEAIQKKKSLNQEYVPQRWAIVVDLLRT